MLFENGQFQITLAVPADVDALVDLHETCFSGREHILVQLGRPFLHAVYRWFVNAPENFVLVARRGDQILGFTTLSDRPYNIPMLRACKAELVRGFLLHPWAIFSTDLLVRLVRIAFRKRSGAEQERVGQIAFTGVDPRFQGQGIGKAMKEASLNMCRRRGLVAVSTGVRRQNPRARLLNEQAGFVEVPSRSTRRLIYLRLELGSPDQQSPAQEGTIRVSRPVQALAPKPRLAPSHIVIVTSYFSPVLAATTHLMKDLAEGLAEGGNRVTVLTNGPSHPGSVIQDHPLLKGRIHRAWNPFIRKLGVFSKVFEYSWFSAFFFLRGLFVRNVDLIFVVSTPPLAGIPAALLAWMKGAKLVYNLQDIFPDSAVVAGFLPGKGLVYRSLRKAEELTYKVSDLVVSISQSFSDYVQEIVPGKAVATIPNWVDTDNIRPRSAEGDPAIHEFRQGGAFVVQYAGNIGFVQNLETLLLAAECLKDHPDIRFVFIGDGNAKQPLEEMARERNLKNCSFLPLQPLDRVASVYNACDLGVIPLKPGAAQIAVPSKTWNYLAAGRPVIGCVEADSYLARVICDSRSGEVVPPDDPRRLAEAILGYRNAPERILETGLWGRDYVETYLSRRVAIQHFIKTFDRLLGRRSEAT
ncbi:MAG TPA: GNAT family N-acetyltransferase [Geothrix sp.]|nr:GNAT family N-acetyltransferase [Geothrix sp.]